MRAKYGHEAEFTDPLAGGSHWRCGCPHPGISHAPPGVLRRMNHWLVWLVFVVACGASPAPIASSTEPEDDGVQVAAPVADSQEVGAEPIAQAEPAESEGDYDEEEVTEFRIEADLVGDLAPEVIEYESDGRVVAGTIEGRGRPINSWMEREPIFEVVELDRETSALLVGFPTSDDEDPPTIYQLFVEQDGALVRILDVITGSYNHNALTVHGDGSVSFIEDGWGACTREEHPQVATVRRIVYRRRGGGVMAVVDREDTGDTYPCNELAACPYVDVVHADGSTQEMGEILRWLHAEDLHDTQTLDLGDVEAGRLVVRLREDKPEVTHLFEVHVEVDGVPLDPLDCGADDAPRYCGGDQEHILREGERIDVVFDVPTAGHAVLSATGYYIPTYAAPLTPIH